MNKLNVWFFGAFNLVYYVLLMLLYDGKISSSDLSLRVITTDWVLLVGTLAFLVLAFALPKSKPSFAILAVVSAAMAVYAGITYAADAISFARSGAWFFTLFVVAFILAFVLSALICLIRLFGAPPSEETALTESESTDTPE